MKKNGKRIEELVKKDEENIRDMCALMMKEIKKSNKQENG